ncbi:hypothetical protein [Streptomyces sp. DSM 15324]|uniref:hypothetical protein n=1 Tax=Streptomyces sp. DSM 15324 TaxID=1739111 RepID=UPI000749EB23|nr:hypothetical protein [Streptomyces sp. DSM 15324]KUO09929.1 hypothetical protein AQJ58_23140 [Streptomyces sp. DSM 15324]
MRPAYRAVPTAARHRLTEGTAGTAFVARTAFTALLALTPLTALTGLLALLALFLAPAPASTVTAPTPATAGRSASVASASDVAWQPDSGPRADDPCAGPYAAQVRSPYDHLGERPHPPDHRAAPPRRVTTAPAVGVAASAPPLPTPALHDRSAYDRGRAPPRPPGI